MEVSGQLHALAALPPGKEPPVPLNRTLWWPQNCSGHGGWEKILNTHQESNHRTLVIQPVAWLLYWRSYPSS